jgi:hypothetical protein
MAIFMPFTPACTTGAQGKSVFATDHCALSIRKKMHLPVASGVRQFNLSSVTK